MAKRRGHRIRTATRVRPPSRARWLLLLSAALMLAGLVVALVAGLGGALAGTSGDAPASSLAGWPGVLAGGGILLFGFALSNAAQGHWLLAAGWALVAAGAAVSLLIPSAPALSLVAAAAGALLVAWQFARRLGRTASRSNNFNR